MKKVFISLVAAAAISGIALADSNNTTVGYKPPINASCCTMKGYYQP